MKIKTLILLATIGCASLAGAADTTATTHGPNFDPDRHARMTAAREAGDTATMNAIRAEHRAQMQSKGQGMGKSGAMGQGRKSGQSIQGKHGGQGGQGGHGGQCKGGAKAGAN